MSARVKHVKRAQKEYTCGKCRNTIAKSDPYRWAKPGFRSKTKLVRCMTPACVFRPSELDTSKMSDAYAAIEGAEDDLGGCETIEDAKGVFEACAEGLRGVAGEYQEASDQWADGQGHEEWQERADMLEEAAQTLDDWADQYDEDEPPLPEDVRAEANDCLMQLELP